MLLHCKNIGLSSNGETCFPIHDYSTIIDIEVYKGGYDEYYCNIFYTTPGNEILPEGKMISLLYKEESKEVQEIHERYKFFKSVKMKGVIPWRYFFFIHEDLSVAEKRTKNIDTIIDGSL